ncbi:MULTISPECIES: hypothetical protein [Halomonadaceae]|uniref:Uncharacterized protein n=2 Tax=Vreelandella TaxID=3137766 RepID=A0A7Z0LXK4_9GAMM|nr:MULTISPECIES: hypothetical protein [Halomonas]NYS80468.1 hypothetical protein [Halomonas glaciei]|tara:strand:+ start:2923 stop:3252 length:330 start_codon:yes stop_codon:yes gene_type:complete
MSIDVGELLEKMLDAAKAVLEEDWPEIKEHAETELKGIAEGIALVERLRLQGKISQKQAKSLIKMKRNTAQIVLLTLEGLGVLAVEKAINAAIKAIKDTVNGTLDFALL